MSYDIKFIQKLFEQTWEEALRQHQERALSNASSPPSEFSTQEQRDRLASLFQQVNPNLSRADGTGLVQLSDEKTGLQLTINEYEVGISIPFQHTGRTAWKLMTHAAKYAKIIERETGLIGYDSQREEAFLHSEEPVRASAELLSSISKRRHPDGSLETTDKPEKPWWKFWD